MIRCEHRKDPAGKTEDAPEEAASGSRDKKPVMKRPAAKMSLPKKAAKARLEEPMEDSPIPSPAEEEIGRCTFARQFHAQEVDRVQGHFRGGCEARDCSCAQQT